MTIPRSLILLVGWLLLALTGSAFSQSVNALAWDFGTTANTLNASTRHPTVSTNPVTLAVQGTNLAFTARSNTGGNTGRFYDVGRWPTGTTPPAALTGTRNSLLPITTAPTMYASYTMGPTSSTSSFANATLRFRYQRSATAAPTRVQAVLVWDDNGTFKRRFSAATTLSAAVSTTTWTTQSLPLSASGSDAFPSGTDIGSKNYLIEMHFYNCSASNNLIRVDDLVLLVNALGAGSPPPSIVTSGTLPNAEQNYAYVQQFTATGGSGAGYTWSLASGSLPPGLSLVGDKLIGVPTTLGTANFVMRVTDSLGGTITKAFTHTTSAAPAWPASGSTLAKWTFDADGTGAAPTSPAVIAPACVTEVTWGWDDNSVGGANHAEGVANTSSWPIGPLPRLADATTRMRSFSKWDTADSYTTTRNSLLHLSPVGATNRFAVYPAGNTASIPDSSKTTTGEPDALQFSITLDQYAEGSLSTFDFYALRWQRDLMNVDGTNGPRYARLYAYYTNDSGTVTRWTSSTLDISAIYKALLHQTAPGYEQFKPYKFDLSTLSAALNATTAKMRSRKIYFDLYTYHDVGADLSNTTNPPTILLDDVAITGNITCTPPNEAVGNLVYLDANDNGRFDAGEGVNGVSVKIFTQGTATSGTPVATATTTSVNGVNGWYAFTGLSPGTYYVHIPASNFASGQPLYGKYSMLGNGGDNGRDDDWDENGIDNPVPAINGISSNQFTLAVGGEPTTSENGQNGGWDDGTSGKPVDANSDLSVDFGFAQCEQSNLMTNGSFETANPVGLTFPDVFPAGGAAIARTRTTTGNTDIAGWTFDAGSYIHDATHATDGSRLLYLSGQGCVGQQFTVGVGSPGVTQLQTGTVYTCSFDWAPFDSAAPNTPAAGNNTGVYADMYYTDSAWTAKTFITSFHDFYEPPTGDFLPQPRALSTWANLDWRRCRFKLHLPAPPAGQNYLTIFVTSNGSAPKILIDNVQLTVACDQTIGTVGNLVWRDANGDGLKDASETGIDQVLVSLYRRPPSGSPVLVGETYTNQGGRYFFTGLRPATYFATVPDVNFASSTPWWLSSGSGPLYNHLSSTGNAALNVAASAATDDDRSEKGIDNSTPAANGISSADFALGAGSEPVTPGGMETGTDGTADDFIDAHGDLTVDFGFVPVAAADYGDYAGFPLASQTASTALRIGTVSTDSENIPTTNSAATGDNITGANDEDLTMPVLTVGSAASLVIPVTATTASLSNGTARVNVFADWNNDGDVLDTNETQTPKTVGSSGNYTFSLTPPANTPSGTKYLRIRITEGSTVPVFSGSSGLKGEVEDYAVSVITASDYGDWNGSGAATTTTFSSLIGNLRLGASVDAEISVTPNGSADADGADEDGVTFAPSLVQGQNGAIVNVALTNLTGNPAFLSAWIDFNRDGDFADAGEQIISNQTVNDGISATSGFSFNVPSTAIIGLAGARFRLSSTSSPPATGGWGSGEIEDHLVNIVEQPGCFQVIVTNFDNDSMVSFRAEDGGLIGTLASGGNLHLPSEMLAHGDGNMLVAMWHNSYDRIEKYNPYSGAWLSTFASPAAQIGTDRSNQLVRGPDGLLYVPRRNTHKIVRFDYATGALIDTYLTSSNGLSTPRSLAFDLSGNMHVANAGTRELRKYSPTGVYLGNTATYASGVDVRAVVRGPDGFLYVLTNTGPSTQAILHKIDPSSGTSTQWVTMATGSGPMVWGPDGYLYVADYDGGNVRVFASNATVVRNLTTSLAGPCGVSLVPCRVMDFGDLAMPFPTDLASNGARHFYFASSLRLGGSCDPDGEGQPSVNADGDDNDSDGDDDDGIVIPSLAVGSTATIIVNSSGSGKVNAFFDWNNDRDFLDSGESIAELNVVAGNNSLVIAVPTFSVADTPIGARFRLSSNGGLLSTGGASDGEVEDYRVTVASTLDYGDHIFGTPAASSAGQRASADIRMGTNATDVEAADPSDANANRDNTTGVNDEDLAMPTLIAGGSGNLVVPVTATPASLSGATARMVVFADWNGDGDVADANETIASQTVSASATHTFALSPPAGTTPGTKYLRVRVSEGTTAPSFGGISNLKGEVEDYAVTVIAPLTIGNLVWNDADNDGAKDAGESGMGGLTVQLWNPGADNAIGGAGANGDVQVGADITTNVSGVYSFTGLGPGRYFVKVLAPVAYLTGGTPDPSDNGDDNDNNGAQPGGPGTALFSPVVELASGTESVSDGDTDSNTNMTVDFGLFGGMALGNWVFNDANNSGSFDSGTESGIGGLAVELLNGGTNAVIASTTTDASGAYGFTVYTPGSYKVRVTPNGTYPLASATAGSDSGTDNNNDGVQPSGQGTASTSFAFTLSPMGEPGASGGSNAENTIDFGFRACPMITPGVLASATVGTAYAGTAAATGGTSPYTYAVSAGALPGWATLNTGTGAITGMPNNTASASFTIRATDANGCQGTRSYTLTPACPVITVTPSAASPLALTQDVAMSTVNFPASGGTAPYAWSVVGTLPSGLSLSGTTGALTGTPTAVESRTFTVRVTDNYGCLKDTSYTVNVGCPPIIITPAVLGPFTQYTAITSVSMSATNTTGVVVWSATNLPAGLALSSSGVLSGNPTASPGSYSTVDISLTDSDGCSSSSPYTIVIGCPAVNISTASLPDAVVGTAYSQTLAATTAGTGVPAQTYTWSVSPALPAGLNLSAAGVLSGTPSAATAAANYTFTATNQTSCQGTKVLSLRALCPAITVTPGSALQSTTGTAYTQTANPSAAGITGTFTWTLGGSVPAGMTINSSTGAISTTAATPVGLYAITVTATSASYPSCSGVWSGNFRVCPVISLAAVGVPTVGTAYTGNATASGGTAPYNYVVTSGALPGWATLNAGTGAITGTPNNTTSATFTVTATDANGCPGTRSYTLTPVCPTITVTAGSALQSTTGTAYTQTGVPGASGISGTFTWTLGGTAPAGMTINSSTGAISTTAATPVGLYAITVTATSASYPSCSGVWSGNFRVCPVISLAAIGVPTVGTAYTGNATASGGTAPYNYVVTSGALPAWATLNAGTGAITGMPNNTTSAIFTVTATDANGCPGSRSYTLTPVCPTITVTAGSALQSTTGTAYTQSGEPSASGISGTFTWTLGGTVPAGMTNDSGTGAISTTAATPAGLYAITVTATSASYPSCSGAWSGNFRVCPVISLAAIGVPTVGTAYTGNATASGGTAPYTYAVTSGALPAWATLNAGTGAITGMPNDTTSASFTITATDANGCPGTQSYTHTPVCPAITVNPPALANGIVDFAYSETVSASGGTAPIVFSITAGALPAGLALAPATGVISGTPTSGAAAAFTITATDAYNCTGSRSYTVTPAATDFGDWNGAGAATAAASSVKNVNIRIGAAVDAEASVTPNAVANVDDSTNTGSADDEDGVTFATALTTGASATIQVSVFNNNTANRYLQAWIDFNNDGTFDNTDAGSGGERVYNAAVPANASAQTVAVSFTVPLGASAGTQRGARFRFTDNAATTPTSSGASGEIEDYVVTIIPGLVIGNLVWNDANNNGVKDAIELGVSGALVQLFSTADAAIGNGDDTQAGANFITGPTGAYSFVGLSAGNFYVKVTPPSAGMLTSGTPATTDNDVDGNNDGSQPGGLGAAVFSPVVNLAAGSESTTDGDANSNTNLTVDFGLFSGITVGSLVFNDVNDSGTYESATESGISGLAVELCDGAGASFSPAIVTTTNASGSYSFSVYLPGTYRVKVTPNGAYPLASSTAGIDNGIDSNNDGTQLGLAGAVSRSFAFTLAPSSEPGTAGTGNTENTIDFGFRACPTVVVDPEVPATPQVGTAYAETFVATGGAAPYTYSVSAGSLPAWATLNPATGALTGLPNNTTSAAFTIRATDVNGCAATRSHTLAASCPAITLSPGTLADAYAGSTYNQAVAFSAVGLTGTYSWSASGVPGGMTFNSTTRALTGTPTIAGSYNIVVTATDTTYPSCSGTATITFRVCPAISVSPASFSDANLGVPFSVSLSASGGASPHVFTVVAGALPSWATLSSAGVLSGNPDNITPASFTIAATDAAGCLGTRSYTLTTRGLSIGNLVWDDFDNDGSRDAGEPGLPTVRVQLFRPGTDGLVNTGDDTQAGTDIFTDASGAYSFTDLMPGDYFVRVTPPPGFPKASGTPDTADNGQDNDNNGTQPGGLGAVLFSPKITLAPGTEPAADGDGTNGDLTVDFGLHTGVQLGNLVWDDANNNGLFDGGESGLAGLTVHLLDTATSTQLASTTTNAGGGYGFTIYTNGTYRVRVLPPASHAVPSSVVDNADNAEDNDNNGSQAGLPGTAVLSNAFAITAGSEPGSGGASNTESTIDIGLRQTVSVGNLVFKDVNNDGLFTAADQVVPGVLVQLFPQGADPLVASPAATAVSDAAGHYLLSAGSGSYFVYVPASQFASGAPLENTRPSVEPALGGIPAVDDDGDQNALTTAKPSAEGVRTPDFTLNFGGGLSAATGETGNDSASDDAFDLNADLTVDLGFYPMGAPGFPLAGRVTRTLSGTTATSGAPLEGVTIAVFEDTDGDGELADSEMNALDSATTNDDGQYEFLLPPGDYIVMQETLPGATAVADSDGGDPSCTNVAMTSSACDGVDFVQALEAQTFAQWREQNALGGENGADQNPDGDLYSNLLEYALGTPAGSGRAASRFRVESSASGAVDAVLVRPVNGHEDVRYILEGIADLARSPAGWVALEITPVVTSNNNGTETLRFRGLDSVVGTTGFARVRVTLDADQNGAPEAAATTPAQGWSRREYAAGTRQTLAMPLARSELFAGLVLDAVGDTLTIADAGLADLAGSGVSCYVEVLTGAKAGHRFEVNEPGCTGTSIALASSGGEMLAGARIALRPHWTLRELLPPALFSAATSAAQADRVLFFDSAANAYRVFWLLAGPAPRWVRDGDATLADAGSRIVRPAEGMMIHVRHSAVSLLLAGQARASSFALPLAAGSHLVGTGAAVALSPSASAMTPASGFVAGSTPETSSRLRFWLGDMTPGASGFGTWSLQATGSGAEWRAEGGASSLNEEKALDPFRAVFLMAPQALPGWVLPAAWAE